MRRFNIWVDNEGPELSSTDVSAVITSTGSAPIIVERAMYASDGAGRLFGAGHESAGITAPSRPGSWRRGRRGTYFDLFILVAESRPAPTPRSTVEIPAARRYACSQSGYTVAANSRFNIWVDHEDPGLANVAVSAVSTTVTSLNGVPVIVERAMWWPGTGSG